MKSRRWLDEARGAPCMIRVPGICRDDRDTTVPCHPNGISMGKGVGMKASDALVAWGCFACHSVIDLKAAPGKVRLSAEEARGYYLMGYYRTMQYVTEHPELLNLFARCFTPR